jgi:ABC-type branched-subunit amino acid transport system permease subunit
VDLIVFGALILIISVFQPQGMAGFFKKAGR